ncbi:MAG: hypothetical protein WCQ99_09445 [Pseudomonadota bacterium]
MKRDRACTILFLTSLVFFSGACSDKKLQEPSRAKLTVKENKDGVEVQSIDGKLSIAGNEKKGRIKITTGEGKDIELTYHKGKLADGFPTDVPLYEPAELKMSQVFQGRNALATLSTKDDLQKVAQFYKDSLPQQGWTQGDEVAMTNMILLQGKKENVSLNISIRKKDTETTINLAVTENKQ